MRSPAKRFYLLISNDFPLRNLMSAAQVPDLFVPLAATVVFAFSGCSASAAAAIAPANCALLCSLSLVVAVLTKSQLKFLFGRTPRRLATR